MKFRASVSFIALLPTLVGRLPIKEIENQTEPTLARESFAFL
jgi:hypothetical protein